MPDKMIFEICDKPLDMMTVEERDTYWLKRTGEHYHEPTESEVKAVKEKFGIK